MIHPQDCEPEPNEAAVTEENLKDHNSNNSSSNKKKESESIDDISKEEKEKELSPYKDTWKVKLKNVTCYFRMSVLGNSFLFSSLFLNV